MAKLYGYKQELDKTSFICPDRVACKREKRSALTVSLTISNHTHTQTPDFNSFLTGTTQLIFLPCIKYFGLSMSGGFHVSNTLVCQCLEASMYQILWSVNVWRLPCIKYFGLSMSGGFHVSNTLVCQCLEAAQLIETSTPKTVFLWYRSHRDGHVLCQFTMTST